MITKFSTQLMNPPNKPNLDIGDDLFGLPPF